MTKLEYLRLAIKQRLYYSKAWIVSCFAITKPSATSNSYVGQLIREPWGYTVKLETEVVTITDAPIDTPLFRFMDVITVDPSMAANVTTEVSTTIGNLLFNLISILPAFGPKYPFVLGKVSVPAIEDRIALLLVDTPLLADGTVDPNVPRDPKVIYTDEYIRFIDSLQFISSLAQLTAYSATPKSITAPPGIKEFKQQLLVKYQGQLTDPVILAKFEAELLAFDQEYLRGDPADGKFISGKIKNVARKKMFLAVGSEQSFVQSSQVTPIENSLTEGWSRDPEQYAACMNGLRIGSYFRGSETVKGGVSAKTLLRSGSNFSIEDRDCGTTLGIHRIFNESTVKQLVGRYVITASSVTLVENITTAANYLNKQLVVRSPMYCKAPGDTLCRVCAGENLFKFPVGLTVPLTEISSIVLATSLKKMHGEALTIAKLDLTTTLS